jgi:hypothetical protein
LSAISFFQSAYFWGLLFLALPLVIHLLGRRRTLRIDFSTLRFFQATAVRAHRTRRFKRLLLLVCRLALLAMIILVFSHPFDKNDPLAILADPDAAIYFWVDPTKSMDYREQGKPLWRRAMDLVDSIDIKTPPSARKFWYDETQNKFVVKPSFHRDKVLFTRYGPSYCQTMIAAFHDEAIRSSRPTALVILSDFQENTGRLLDSIFERDTMKSPIICVSCAPHRPWNGAILHTVSSGERPAVVTSDLMAWGKDGGRWEVSAFLGDMRVGHMSVDRRTGSPTPAAMEITGGNSPGGYVRLETEDPFMLDNVRYFVLGRSTTRRVLVIGDSLPSFPIAAALSAIGDRRWRPVIRRSPGQLGVSDIDSADLIVCNETPFALHPLELLRTTRLFGPKAIVISPAVDSGSLHSTGGSAMGLRTTAMEKPCGIVFYDTLSKLWKGFHSLKQSDAAVYRFIEPLPGAVLCGMDNRKPFATHLLDTLGHSWVFVATPLGATTSNNLCETGLYVPLLDRIARFALEAIHSDEEEWIAGRPRRNPFLGFRHSATVYDVRGERLSVWGSQLNVTFDEPGVYRIQPRDEPTFWIAVNPDPEEMKLVFYSPKEWKKRLGHIIAAHADEFLESLRTGKGFAFSYGPWAIITMLLAMEMLLWERGGSRQKEPKRRKAGHHEY